MATVILTVDRFCYCCYHRHLKLRTDSGHAVVRELVSTVHRFFIVISLKINHCHQILNVNSQLCIDCWLQICLRYDQHFVFYYGRPSASWLMAIIFCCQCLGLIFCHLISEVSWPIVAKLCHTFDGDCDL